MEKISTKLVVKEEPMKSWWSMAKENFDSPGEIIPIMALVAVVYLVCVGKISDTIFLGGLGLCLGAHAINHSVDPADKE